MRAWWVRGLVLRLWVWCEWLWCNWVLVSLMSSGYAVGLLMEFYDAVSWRFLGLGGISRRLDSLNDLFYGVDVFIADGLVNWACSWVWVGWGHCLTYRTILELDSCLGWGVMRFVHLFRVNGYDSGMFDFHSLFFLIVCFIFLLDVEIASVSLISVLTRRLFILWSRLVSVFGSICCVLVLLWSLVDLICVSTCVVVVSAGGWLWFMEFGLTVWLWLCRRFAGRVVGITGAPRWSG